MDRNQFQEEMLLALKNVLGEEYDVGKEYKYAGNEVTLYGLRIGKLKSKISPVYYLDQERDLFKEGVPIQKIAQDMAMTIRNQEIPLGIGDIANSLKHYENIKNMVRCKLINTEANRSFLERISSVPFLDLSIVFYIDIEHIYKNSYITVTNSHMKMWSIKDSQILNDSVNNMTSPTIENMNQVLKAMIPDADFGDMDCDMEPLSMRMFVIKNEDTPWAPISILFPGVLEELAEEMDGDIIILPSSIYEVILLVDTGFMSYEEASDMVNSINKEVVKKEEWLSNSVYRYSRSTKVISIVFQGKELE